MRTVDSRRWVLAAITIMALVIAGFGMRGAASWYGKPFAGVLLDPDGIVSSIGLPSWEGFQKGLRYPDRLLEVDGERVEPTPGRYRAHLWDRHIEQAARDGKPTIHAAFETKNGPIDIELSIVPFDPLAWWLYAGGLMLIACLYAGAALIVMSVSPRSKLARTFAKTALFAALFLFTLFDYHSSRDLVPFFHIAYALVPMGFFILPLRLPDDVAVLNRHPWIVVVLDTIGALFAFAMLAMHAMGATTMVLRNIVAILFGLSFLFFAIAFLVRFARAGGDRRRTLRALSIAMVPIHVVIGLGAFLAIFGQSASLAWCATPALALTPVSSVFALIRYDLWGSRALLSRPLTRVIIAVVMLAFTVVVCAACAALAGLHVTAAFKVAAPAAVLGAGLVVFALRAGDRTLFPARANYKPTVEQLSEELTLITVPEEVVHAVERTVRRWLPCEKVVFRQVEEAPEDNESSDAESSGERLIVCRPLEGSGHELSLRVTFRGRTVGILEVGRKQAGALYTSEDLDLLRTIANQAALAMAHARLYAELERRRREQAAAWRDEREALIETVAAEITHEVRYPINFFRSVFQRGSSGQRLDAEEVEIGCEEVERLERLVMGLRRVTHRKLERRCLDVEELITKAEMLLRDQLGRRKVDIHVRGTSSLRCDADQVTQVLVNLLSNGLDAAGEAGSVGVAWLSTAEGAELSVWDTGPGFAGDPSKIFSPWYTTKPRGTGLGLAITHRIVRAHGWIINANRHDNKTRFVISIPAADIAEAQKNEVA